MTDTLIDIVKNYPLLYNAHPKDKDTIYRIWRQVAKEAGLESGKIAKAKWRNIRDSYVKYVKAHLDPENPALRRHSKWPWASRMKFMNIHICNALWLGHNTEAAANFHEFFKDEISDSAEFLENSEHTDVHTEHVEFLDDSLNPADSSMNTNNEETITIINQKTPTKASRFPWHNVSLDSLDSIDLLFMGYAETVKKFSARRRVEAKFQLATLINKLECEQIQEDDEMN